MEFLFAAKKYALNQQDDMSTKAGELLPITKKRVYDIEF